MKKKNFAFLVLVAMMLSACGQPTPTSSEEIIDTSEPSSSEIVSTSDSEESSESSSEHSSESSVQSSEISSEVTSSSSSEEASEYLVEFAVDGNVIQSSMVAKGGLASYTGQTPTKQPDENAIRYRFRGWDRSLDEPIVAYTRFNAVFAEYVREYELDDFEDYRSSGNMIDAGWCAKGYTNADGWTTETKAAVSLGKRAAHGEKSIRFDSWLNGSGYKICKSFEEGEIKKDGNAFRFCLMTPVQTVKVIIYITMEIGGSMQSGKFTYVIKPNTKEFVTYTVPFDADGWYLWENAGQTIKLISQYAGINEDDIVYSLTDIEFYLEGTLAGNPPALSFLDNFQLVTLDAQDKKYSEIEELHEYKRFSALTTSGNTLTINIGNDGTAIARVVDLETPVEVTGKVTVEGKTITFKSNDNGASLTYSGKITNAGQLIKFSAASGAFASEVDEIDLLAVQAVDDFESYTEDGVAYYQENDPTDRSGARGAYYTEYYSDNPNDETNWGGVRWHLSDNGDDLKLIQDSEGAHSGNNYLSLRNDSRHGFRYMQWGLYDGSSQKNSFRGNKMGFWARTDGLVKQFQVFMYSQTSPTNANRDQYVKTATFTALEAIEGWTHYEIELNPNAVYYGFMIFVKEHWLGKDTFLFIDDVEIYAANPYAKYEAPAAPELPVGGMYQATINGLVNVKLGVGADYQVSLKAPLLGEAIPGTYEFVENKIEMTFGDVKYVVTYDEEYDNLTYDSVTGIGMVAQYLANLSFARAYYGEDCESYTEDGVGMSLTNDDITSFSGARGAYYCDAYTGNTSQSAPVGGIGWNLTDGDVVNIDKSTYVEGKQSLKIKDTNTHNNRFMPWDLYQGTAKPINGVNKFSIYIKNPGTKDVTIQLMVYKVNHITTSTQGDGYRVKTEKTKISAGTDWAKYSLNLDSGTTYYGFVLLISSDWKGDGYLNIDAAHYESETMNPSLDYTVNNAVSLKGTTLMGEVQIGFSGVNGVTFVVTASSDSLTGTYEMSRAEGGHQLITLVVGNTTIVGTYEVDFTSVAITVISAEGDLANAVQAGTVFSNAN